MTEAHPYAQCDFWTDREAVIRANEGRTVISMIGLLPDAPEGRWGDVSATIAALASPLSFLTHLFVDTACPSSLRLAGAKTVWFDGILSSAGYQIDSWALLPAIGVWARSPRLVDSAIRHLGAALQYWHGGKLPEKCQRASLADPEDLLRGFVPYGKLPNRRLLEAFIDRAAPMLGVTSHDAAPG